MRAEVVKATGEIIDCGEVLVSPDGQAALAVFHVDGALSDERRELLTRRHRGANPGYCIVLVGNGDVWQLVKSAAGPWGNAGALSIGHIPEGEE